MMRPGLLVIDGRIGTADLHAHHSVQVLVSREDEVVLRDAAGHEFTCRAGVVPADVPHAVVRGARDGLLMHFDPESAAGAALAGVAQPGEAAVAWGRAAAALGVDSASGWLWGVGAAGSGTDSLESVRAAVREWMRTAMLGDSGWLDTEAARPNAGQRHRAVAELLRLLPDRLDSGPIRLRDLAESVHLSESRLAHVFSADIGLPLRPYVRWLRMQRAIELLASGDSLTAVAHGAGFADSAHLTRVCRRMFGAPPSEFAGIRWVARLPR